MLSALWTWFVAVWFDAGSSVMPPQQPDFGGDPSPPGPPPK